MHQTILISDRVEPVLGVNLHPNPVVISDEHATLLSDSSKVVTVCNLCNLSPI
nr:MAG TPA: hypothetical protein [Caudoviricetes sp.]